MQNNMVIRLHAGAMLTGTLRSENSLKALHQYQEFKNFLITVIFKAEWSEWTDWSICSKTCNGGESKRTRKCVKRQQNYYEFGAVPAEKFRFIDSQVCISYVFLISTLL